MIGTCRMDTAMCEGEQGCTHPQSCVADIALVSVDDLETPVDSHVLCTLG